MRSSPEIRQQARDLRKRLTEAEGVLWRSLRNRQLGARWRRQHPIGPYIADFCCAEARLVVELDGPVHEGQAERDESRTFELEQRGYRVLRFTNDQVMHDLFAVLNTIRDVCSPGTPSPGPSTAHSHPGAQKRLGGRGSRSAAG